MKELPLLAQGLKVNVTAAAAPNYVRGSFETGRGNVKGFDLVHNGIKGAQNGGKVSVSVGGLTMVDLLSLSNYNYNAEPNYKPLSINVDPNQTYEIMTIGVGAGTNVYSVAFYENPLINNPLYDNIGGLYSEPAYNLRRLGIVNTVPFLTASQSLFFTMPQDKGKTVGVEMQVFAATGTAIASFFTVRVNGVTIFDNVNGGFFDGEFGRRKSFPIIIPAGSRIELIGTNANLAGQPIDFALTPLYLDNNG